MSSFVYSSFVVESTDISHADVRIKETDNTFDKTKLITQKSDFSNATRSPARKDSKKSGSSHNTCQKRKNFSRSQSVTAPKSVAPKPEPSFSYSRQSSFSTMSDADLENWKLNIDSTRSSGKSQEEPVLTVASSLTDSSNVTMGFDIKQEEKK